MEGALLGLLFGGMFLLHPKDLADEGKECRSLVKYEKPS